MLILTHDFYHHYISFHIHVINLEPLPEQSNMVRVTCNFLPLPLVEVLPAVSPSVVALNQVAYI